MASPALRSAVLSPALSRHTPTAYEDHLPEAQHEGQASLWSRPESTLLGTHGFGWSGGYKRAHSGAGLGPSHVQARPCVSCKHFINTSSHFIPMPTTWWCRQLPPHTHTRTHAHYRWGRRGAAPCPVTELVSSGARLPCPLIVGYSFLNF